MMPAEPELPIGWVWATFGDLLSEPLANGLSIKGSETPPGVPALKLNAMSERGFDWSKVRYLPIDWDKVVDLEIQEGDFFISRGNGSLALVGRGTSAQKPTQRVIFPDTMIRARIREPIRSTGWVQTVWSCPGVREQIERRVKTTAGIWKISQGELESIRLPIPPLPEQTRIVGEVQKQLTRLDAGVEALKRVQAQLKRYRASVLKAACEGRLVPTEAELARREKRDYEPADRLLARILKERRARWEADQIAKMKAAGKPPKDNKWKAKYSEPHAPDVAGLPSLPEGWVWAGPDQLAAPDDWSLGIGPFGSNLKVSDYRDAGVPLVFVRNIRSGQFGAENRHYVTKVKADELRPHEVRPGDVLVTKMGEPPGDSCLYPASEPVGVITADCIRLRLSSLLLHREFFVHCINSQVVREQVLRLTQGVAQQKISLERFRTLALPVPPLEEQQRILGCIDEHLSVELAVRTLTASSNLRATRLRQAVLRRAFEGSLGPQDPRDEAAAKLLERIAAVAESKLAPKQSQAKQTTAVSKMKATR